MGLFEPTHLLILALVVLLLFGGKKIPELMRGVGQGVGELQKGLHEAKFKLNEEVAEKPIARPADSPTIPATGVPVDAGEQTKLQA